MIRRSTVKRPARLSPEGDETYRTPFHRCACQSEMSTRTRSRFCYLHLDLKLRPVHPRPLERPLPVGTSVGRESLLPNSDHRPGRNAKLRNVVVCPGRKSTSDLRFSVYPSRTLISFCHAAASNQVPLHLGHFPVGSKCTGRVKYFVYWHSLQRHRIEQEEARIPVYVLMNIYSPEFGVKEDLACRSPI